MKKFNSFFTSLMVFVAMPMMSIFLPIEFFKGKSL